MLVFRLMLSSCIWSCSQARVWSIRLTRPHARFPTICNPCAFEAVLKLVFEAWSWLDLMLIFRLRIIRVHYKLSQGRVWSIMLTRPHATLTTHSYLLASKACLKLVFEACGWINLVLVLRLKVLRLLLKLSQGRVWSMTLTRPHAWFST